LAEITPESGSKLPETGPEKEYCAKKVACSSAGFPFSSQRVMVIWPEPCPLISPLTALLIKSTTSLIEPELDCGAHAMQEPVGLLLSVKLPSSVIVSTSGSWARAGGSGRTKMAIRVATTDPRSGFLNISLPPETVCECRSGHHRVEERLGQSVM
jgi:hypothetical protein